MSNNGNSSIKIIEFKKFNFIEKQIDLKYSEGEFDGEVAKRLIQFEDKCTFVNYLFQSFSSIETFDKHVK